MWIIIILLIVISYLFIHYKQKYDFSKYDKEIPGPKGYPLIGNGVEFGMAPPIGKITKIFIKHIFNAKNISVSISYHISLTFHFALTA